MRHGSGRDPADMILEPGFYRKAPFRMSVQSQTKTSEASFPATRRGEFPGVSTDLTITALYAAVAGFLLWHHAMWSDEAEQWLMVKGSHSLRQLYENLRYEFHPVTWYLLLYPLGRISNDIDITKIPTFICSVLFIYIVLKHFLLNIYEKIAFPLGFYCICFFPILERPYIFVSLLEVVSILLVIRRRDPLLVCLSIALSGSIHVIWSCLSLALLIYYVAVCWADEARRIPRRFWVGITLALVVMGVSIAQVLPSEARDDVVVSLAPKNMGWDQVFSNILTFGIPRTIGIPIFGSIYAGLFYHAFRCDWRIAGFMAASTIPAIVMLGVVPAASVPWHTAAVYLAMLMTVFLVRARSSPDRRIGARVDAILIVMLLVQVFVGRQTLIVLLQKPFSQGQATADFIKSYCKDPCPVVAYSDIEGAIVSAYLGNRPVYYANRGEFGTFNQVRPSSQAARQLRKHGGYRAFPEKRHYPVPGRASARRGVPPGYRPPGRFFGKFFRW